MTMGSSSHQAYSRVTVVNSDGSEACSRRQANIAHQLSNDRLFENFVRRGEWNAPYFTASMLFRRHGPKRPYVATVRQQGAPQPDNVPFGSTYNYLGNRQLTFGWPPPSGAVSYSPGSARRYSRRSYGVDSWPGAFGSLSAHVDFGDFNQNNLPRGLGPAQSYGRESLADTDIVGTTIGNMFQHPPGRVAWFNELAIVANSQGQVVVEGTFSPPVESYGHYGYLFYYTKSGGTGAVQGDVKSSGQTDSSAPARFTDSTFDGFVAGDVGKYIAVHGRGIYLITAFVDSANVDTDAVDINEPFDTASGLTWTLRTGPIAEYFWRRRPYFHGLTWENRLTTDSDVRAVSLDSQVHVDSANLLSSSRPVYDGHGHWWWARHSSTASGGRNAAYGLCRWLHMSPQHWQSVVSDGVVDFGADWLGASRGFTGVARDKDNVLWIYGSASGSSSSNYILSKVEPCPGGDASAPSLLARWRKQQSDSDAGGLTGKAVAALCVDTSGVYSGGAGTQRIWAISDAADDSSSGVSYSDDSGVTWKRLHQLSSRTGTATATNGSAAVTGSGTLFDTQFAVGDWIRFGADTRSYEISVITDDLNMTLAESYQGSTGSGKTLQRGALAANEAVAHSAWAYVSGYTAANQPGDYSSIDWDTDGNVFWISGASPRRVCKWNPGTGQVTSFAETSITAVSGVAAVASGTVAHLQVSRIPDRAGSGSTPFHNDIWLGCQSGDVSNTGGWIRVVGSTFTSSPTASNFTRYHPSTVDDFPASVRARSSGTSNMAGNTAAVMSRDTGHILLLSQRHLAGTYSGAWLTVRLAGAEYWRVSELGSTIFTGVATSSTTGTEQANQATRCAFDDTGMGMTVFMSAKDSTAAYLTTSHSPTTVSGTIWIDRRWNGSSWQSAVMTCSPSADLDVRTLGYSVFAGAADVGSGVKRACEWPVELEFGMTHRFQQAGGSVAQSDEFIVDETSTFVAYLGAGKDNTQTVEFQYDWSVVPTVRRVNTESIKTVTNPWSVDGGCDGSFANSISAATGPFTLPTVRGAAGLDNAPAGRTTAAGPYPIYRDGWTQNSSNAIHAIATQRLADEGEFAGDGSVSSGGDVFTTAGAYTFTSSDVGKSLFVEGADGASPSVDNGQAVIMELLSPTSVRTDKVFSQNLSGFRWKLRDVPAVSFVVAALSAMSNYGLGSVYRSSLWSSSNFGESWGLVAERSRQDQLTAGVPDPNFSGSGISKVLGYRHNQVLFSAETTDTSSLFFDLRGLPENVRRRQSWRIRIFNEANVSVGNSNLWAFSGIRLLDENMALMCRPAANAVDDASDDLFFAVTPVSAGYVVQSGVAAEPAADGGPDIGLTSAIDLGPGLHLHSGSDDASLSAGGVFTAPSSIFNRLSVGRFVRIHSAVNPGNNGMALVTGYISPSSVQLSRNFVAETDSFGWQVTLIGTGDKVVLFSTDVPPHIGTGVEETSFEVSDVPSDDVVVTYARTLPLTLSDGPVEWLAFRPPNQVTEVSLGADYPLPDDGALCVNQAFGTITHSDNLEFVVVQQSMVTATTPADDDGDMRTDRITVAENLVSDDGPAVGDVLEVSQTALGTRFFEIKAITGSDPNKAIVVTYDELPVSLTGVSWRVLRRRGLTLYCQELVVSGDGAQL